jgi:anthranilate/para-aminobenzoate synthase component I
MDLIRATFPPGSITGAPKVRAMQIIDELEPFERASYCGSMMVLNDAQVLKASVTIRTAHIWGKADPDSLFGITDGHFVYPVGAGIVADSVPLAEWEETLVKAKVIVSALGSTILDDE